MLFGYKSADETRRRFHLKLWNVYNFFVTYSNLDGWVPASPRKPGKPGNILDKWILLRLDQTGVLVTEALEKFDSVGASGEIEKFVDDLSLWYIRRSRDRVGPAGESGNDANAFYSTTYYVLYTLCKLLSPFTPFLADVIYTNLTKDDSVHLTDWPDLAKASSGKPSVDQNLVLEMQKIREIVEKVHAVRKESGIPVRQPLGKLQITNYKLQIVELKKLLLDELNIKEIFFKEGKGELGIELDMKITPELKEEADARELVRNIQGERRNLGLNLSQQVDVTLETIPGNKVLLEWMTKKAQIAVLKKGKFKVTRHP
jgi:isoleucyl-tRNA synthetase